MSSFLLRPDFHSHKIETFFLVYARMVGFMSNPQH
uniref:Uncharacterized protein n=1 Tax=Rhizophora mucronata TaxID=61149 RepID=A0A2P2QYB3_RHIMU